MRKRTRRGFNPPHDDGSDRGGNDAAQAPPRRRCALTLAARVVIAGIGVLDQVWEMPALPAGPGKIVAAGHRTTGGGIAATAAVAVARLGGHASWLGRLGDDATGATLLALLARHGVDAAGTVPTPGARSPTSGVFVDSAGERVLAVFPGAGLPTAPAFTDAALHAAAAVMGDHRWPEATEHLFRLAAARNLPRILDADANAPGALRRLAPLADHVLFSARGLADFTEFDDPRAGLAGAAAALPGATVAVTLGAAGSLWWRDGAPVPLPAPGVAARDTTGCGDVFHGAYALALAEGRDVPEAARFATAAAALKAANGDGWDGMPDRAAVEALLRAGWS